MSAVRSAVLIAAAIGAIAVIAVVIAVTLPGTSDSSSGRSADVLTPALLIDPDAEFAALPASGELRFPADHSSHDEYRTEAWLVSGIVMDRGNRLIGLQFSIFRIGLLPGIPERESRWAASNAYVATIAVSNPGSGRLAADYRLSRAALGLAGSSVEPISVWVENWALRATGSDEEMPDLRLDAEAEGVALSLELSPTGPLLDGRALSATGVERGPPFDFYSQPAYRTSGTIVFGDDELEVQGTLGLEHAWGELPLPGGPVGRDRLVIHLEDGRQIVLLRSHAAPGINEPSVTGLLLEAEGRTTTLTEEDIRLEPIEYWTSKRTGASYPVEWDLGIPAQGIDLRLEPEYIDQEAVLGSRFWIGPVRAEAGMSGANGTGLVQAQAEERD